MIKLDSPLPALAPPSAPALEQKLPPRLIVLIPDTEVDYNPVMQRIWELARQLKSRVLFLGLCRDESEEPRLRRALVTMAALIQDGWVSAEAKTEIGNNWLRVIKSNWREGDLIVCFAEQRTGLMQKPLSQILESRLNATVYLLSGPDLPVHRTAGWLSTLTLWGGFAVTAIGFFILQVNIDRAMRGWTQMVTLVLTVLVEFWLIWVWNNLFS
ncbi:MAG TPA: hypothetical protein VFR47_12620 [Anaerolineales bacterium]|nr:hypothetical protein [Anaerolineales bacterium]